MNRTNEKGSALILVMISSMFLIILTGAAFRYFKMNADTQIWSKERIQAKLTAEAGVNLATHMLIAGASLPTDSNPAPILGTESSHFVLPYGMGEVYATVDPSNDNDKVTTANAYLIRCIGFTSGSTIESFGMESIVMPENLSRFSVFMDDPPTSGYYGDGYRFDGPFYANGPVAVYSSSPTHENDPFFYSFRLTSDYYWYGYGSSGSHETTPAAGNLQMRPYERLCLGAPYFELGIDPIPFGSDELNWQGVRSAAQSGGLFLTTGQIPSGSRLALKGDTLFVKKSPGATVDTYFLGDLENPVVWIENGDNDKVYIRGDQNKGLDMPLTLAGYGDFYMSGPLHYENMDLEDQNNDVIFGLMSVHGDLVIADAPNTLPDPAWGSEHFQIATVDSLAYCAALVSLDGQLKAEKHWEPNPVVEFQVVGGYMVQAEGYTSAGSSGFNMGVYFDPRLLFMHPPFFPTTSNWNTTMWAERPDMTVSDVTNGDPPY